MVTTRELVAQRPLAGAELAKIITSDVADILSQSGMLSGHIAYGRVAYEVRVILHMDNPAYPRDESVIRSRAYPQDRIDSEPELAAIESLPLAQPSPDAYLAADELHRDIVSPNAARVEAGLPITVIRRAQNSETREELVQYDKSAIEGQANPNPPPVISDVTESVRQQLKERK